MAINFGGDMQPWERLSIDDSVRLDPWKSYTRKVFRQPDGKEKEYYTWNALNARAAGVIALTGGAI